MCKGISMVITKDRIKPYYIDGNNSHNDIRAKHNISDGEDYPSLPVEFLPTGILTKWIDWKFALDINNELPIWYIRNKEQYIDACYVILRKIIDKIKNTGVYNGSLDLRGTGIKPDIKYDKICNEICY